MKHFKKLALAAIIALAGVTSVQAQQIAGLDTPAVQLNTYGGTNQWEFSDTGLMQFDDVTQDFTGPAETRAKGSSFIDVFFVNIPDNEYVYFDFGNARGAQASVAFTGFALGYAYGTGPVVDVVDEPGKFSVTTDTYMLGSGTYEFDISGTFTQANGTFEGDIYGAPVPEPGNWALMFAGLGAVGVLARRRRARA